MNFDSLISPKLGKLAPLPEANNPTRDFIAIPVEFKVWAVKNANSGVAVEYGPRAWCQSIADELNHVWSTDAVVQNWRGRQ